jgi:hypothetical protein
LEKKFLVRSISNHVLRADLIGSPKCAYFKEQSLPAHYLHFKRGNQIFHRGARYHSQATNEYA